MESCSPSSRKTYLLSLGILTGMFFIFGAVSWVNSILIPYFRICCELTHFESYFVSFAFYIAYFIMAIPSGILLKRVGFKRGIMQGFLLTALGAFLFIPAALTRQFGIFLLGLFAIGTGLAILQTAANPYVTIIGPIDSAARRMSLMGIFNKTAGILAPLVLAGLILRPEDSQTFALIDSGTLGAADKALLLDELIRRVIGPYAALGVILLLVGIGMVGGTWYEKGTWRRFRDYSATRLTFAKASAYLFLYIPLMLYMFSFQYKFFGYPMNGNHTDLLLVFIPYLLSVIFLGLTFGALFRRRETSMMVLIVTSVFFLIVSGISWPKEGMPEWLYALGRLAPSSSGIDALVRIRTMGATLQQVAPEIITLWILTGVYGITAVVATRRRTHELRTAAEAARQERKMRELSNNI